MSARILGMELAGSTLTYVLVVKADSVTVNTQSRIVLSATRSRDALVAFQSAVASVMHDAAPTLIAIKEKPENGRMRAGAAALKMEGIVLANATCDVTFVSGAKINKTESAVVVPAYLQPALKAALACL